MNEYKRVENIKKLFKLLIDLDVLTKDELEEITIQFMDEMDPIQKIREIQECPGIGSITGEEAALSAQLVRLKYGPRGISEEY